MALSIGVLLGHHGVPWAPPAVPVSPLQLVVLNGKLRCIEIQVPNDDVLQSVEMSHRCSALPVAQLAVTEIAV